MRKPVHFTFPASLNFTLCVQALKFISQLLEMLGSRIHLYIYFYVQRKVVIFKISLRLFLSECGEKLQFLEVVKSGHSLVGVAWRFRGPCWWALRSPCESGDLPTLGDRQAIAPRLLNPLPLKSYKNSCHNLGFKDVIFICRINGLRVGKTFFSEPVWILARDAVRGLRFLFPLLFITSDVYHSNHFRAHTTLQMETLVRRSHSWQP